MSEDMVCSIGLLDVKDLGDLHYFLGIKVHNQVNGIFLNREKYASDILARAGMSSCTPCPTPLSTRKILNLIDGSPLGPKDITHYISIVWVLQYHSIRSVNKVC
jgi:histone deacetylase 1/2